MQRLFKCLGVIGQLGVGWHDDIVDQILQHLTKISFLSLRESGTTNDGIGSLEFADHISTTVYSALAKRLHRIIASRGVQIVVILIDKWFCLGHAERCFLVVLVIIITT